MPFWKCPKNVYNTRKMKIAQRNGWKHAICKTKRNQLDNNYYSLYKGQWENDKKQGKGMERNKFNWVYEGDWLNDKKHGYGVLSKFENNGNLKKCYSGHWFEGKKQGLGNYWDIYGNCYQGSFHNDNKNGYGVIRYKNGSIYCGDWQNNLYHGYGILTEANSNRYEGQFAHGRKEGEGIFHHSNTGQIQRGLWVNDVCKHSTIEDTYMRQSVPHPTPYPIPKNKVYELDEFLLRPFRS